MSQHSNDNHSKVTGTKVWSSTSRLDAPDARLAPGSSQDLDSIVRAIPEATRAYADPGAPGLTFAHGLQPGAFVKERYRILSHLAEHGGESELYLCEDEHLPDTHPDRQVVLKLYKPSLAPKQEVLNAIRNLAHPDLIRILDKGTWYERFYEVLEYCRGGSMADAMPYRLEALLGGLDQIVAGLDYCHCQGIIHRDVKPNNLLYRDPARTDLVLADFGISSYLRKWQDGGPDRTRTGSAGRHTLDYTAPELFGQDEVSPKTDYYGLGITLMHLLTGHSPFEGWRDEQVIAAHVSNTIPLPTGIDAKFGHLLRGLTQRKPENRWGIGQFRQWRDGKAVTNDQGRPWQHQAYVERPYPYYKQATTLTELARSLDQFDAARRLVDGSIRHWVADFDDTLADRIAELEKTVEKNPALAVKRLGWLLDPDLPLIIDR